MAINAGFFLDKVLDVVCRINREHKITYISESGKFWLNTTTPQENFLDLVVEEDKHIYLTTVADLDNVDSVKCELRIIRDSKQVWVELTLIPLPKTDQITVCIKDISSWKSAEQMMQYASEHDSLTGLGNRVLLKKVIPDFISLTEKTKTGFAFLVLDLDGFKKVNDSLGHPAGDEVLVETARRLVASVRTTDVVIRLGGDEFVILLQGIDSEVNITAAASKILRAIQMPYVVSGSNEMLHLSTSIGVAFSPLNGKDYELLMRNADIAMYDSKKQGKNKFTVYREKETEGKVVTLENSMYTGIREGEFYLVYQPQFLADGKTIVGAEALMRWKSETYGEISPVNFIPLAEENGLIEYLGNWALRASCFFLAGINKHAPNFTVSVNVSSRQLQSPKFLKTFKALIHESEVNPKNLTIEITESFLMQDPETIRRLLEKIAEIGVKISVDDFGTGYSSLSYLSKFSLSALKIDKSFIDNVVNNKQDRTITTAIIGLAQDLGLYSVAEGVENLEQVKLVDSEGCHIIQGYVFSKPVMPNVLKSNIEQKIWITK